jgi:ABC-2 type transport system permease protein
MQSVVSVAEVQPRPRVVSVVEVPPRPRLYWVFSDTWELFRRSAIQIGRTPAQLITAVILQPVLLIIMFKYVFGGAVDAGDTSYSNFMIPGVFIMNCVLVSAIAAIGIASDMTNGVIDRFRSLPMVKSAILGGTILANTIRSLAAVAAMLLVGFLVGFRPDASLGAWLGAIALLMLITYAFTWLMAGFGLMAGTPEGAQQMTGLLWPLAFVSSVFVPAASMPGWLQAFANNQPITHAVEAVRALLLGQPVGNHVWITVLWCVGITAASVVMAGALLRRRFR